ncbi:MAG: acyl-CoA dehydrogenase family protein [Gammaproteobacteria bacterium]
MDFSDSPADARYRSEVRAWLDANAPRHLDEALRRTAFAAMPDIANVIDESRAWQARKAAAGWACLHWPKKYGGREATPIERMIWEQEEGIYAALTLIFLTGIGDCAPTLMEYAAEEQKLRLLPPMASGAEIWCQLFSEPAAGSDLAGVRTRAVREGDAWVVNGQKIWTSAAHVAAYGLLIARTDPRVPKHKGLTAFFLDMKSPGVTVRPVRQAGGQSGFNEVFFDDVRIADEQRLGAVGEGWKVAITTLMHERVAGGTGAPTGVPEFLALVRSLQTPGGRAIEDPAVRERLADWAVRHNGLKFTAMRTATALAKNRMPGPEGGIGKLVFAPLAKDVAQLALDLQGEAGVLTDPALAAAQGHFQALLMRSLGYSIEAGTDEILRNTIAERVLGLPPDIRVDKDIPFDQVPAGPR